MRRASRPAAALLVLGLAASACFAASEPVPDVVNRYLTAVRDGDFETAYRLTQFGDSQAGPGFALTLAHFEGFHERNPLEGFTVTQVVPQEITERTGVKGEPFWTIDLELRYATFSSEQTVFVQGAVTSLHKVQIEPSFLPLRRTAGFPDRVLVDGVPTLVGTQGDATNITLLRGEHDLVIGTTQIAVSTDPLNVLSGPAVIDDGIIALTT